MLDAFSEKMAQDADAEKATIAKEVRHVRVFGIETAIQSIAAEQSTGREVLAHFRRAIEEFCRLDDALGEGFLQDQELRDRLYEEAWADPRGVGQGTAIGVVFAELCGQKYEPLLSIPGSALLFSHAIEYTELLRGIRIVSG